MPHYCCVPLCTSDGRRDKGVSFFSWPNDSEMSKRWIIAIRRDVGPYFKLTKSTRVCSKHFHEDDFESTTQFTLRRRIKKSAIPSIFAWTNKEGIWSTMNEMDANVSSMDIYIKTEPVDPENETTPSTSSLGNQTGTQQQHNVYNSPVLSSITMEQHNVYNSPVLSSITTEQHHVSNSPVLSSMLGSRPNPTPRGVLWTPHGPSHDNSVQGVDRGLSSSLSRQGPTQTDATNKSLSLQKYGKQISFNSAATKLTRLASQYIENESDPKESQLKNSENWNNKSQGTSDKKHRAFPVSMVKTDAVKTIPVGEPNNENPADGVEDAVIHFSIRQGLVDAIVKVFISVSREKSNLININNKGYGFSTISALIADQILSKYLVIPKHVPVSKTAKNEEGRKGGGKELVSQNADTSSVDNDLILNVKVECNSPSDFTQDQTMTDDSQDLCTSAESSSYVNRENHEEKFIKKQQTENHDARSDDFMVKTTEGTETPPEENYSSLQTDTDIDIKMEVETDSECEGDDVNNDDDTEDDNALSNIHTVHNTDGTMKILLPNPKVLENFNRRRGISVDISRENTHGNPEVTERDTSSFSTLKQALIPTGSIKVSSVDNSLPCLHARSPIDPHEELLALQEKAKIGNLTPGEKKKLVEIIEIKQNYNYRKQTIQEEIQLANLNIPNMPTDVPQIKPKLHQFDPSQELLALQEKARVGHLTDEEKKAFIDIIEVQQRYKQMNKKSHSSDQQNPDSKQSEMQTDTLSVEKPMIPFTYEEDTSGLDRISSTASGVSCVEKPSNMLER
ncbi:hypothetical protein FSP39_024789 [Pinctada imbricata]|uniref:THAP-type domain-containing protein n=1 Tax=Pinctada imbricata TaxID=66713 RepID=A0AA88YGB4_PINIB|nr:hypothetical protein FSP39_024789 [Pinctada imbricata]